MGSDQEFQFTSLGTINLNAAQKSLPEYNPAADGRTPVISLASPASDGGDILDGEEDFLKSDENKNSVSFDLVEKGLVYEPKNGRIDAQWGTPAPKPAEIDKPDKAEARQRKLTVKKPQVLYHRQIQLPHRRNRLT